MRVRETRDNVVHGQAAQDFRLEWNLNFEGLTYVTHRQGSGEGWFGFDLIGGERF